MKKWSILYKNLKKCYNAYNPAPTMKLFKPLLNYVIVQKFGQNSDPLYKAQGLLGHTGLDLQSIDGYDATVSHSISGFVYKVINQGDPVLMDYRAVFVLADGGDGFFYEVSYGHLDKILTPAGVPSIVGEPLGTEGNTGVVYEGDSLVTEQQKEAGSKAGAHLHFQVRQCKKSFFLDPTCKYLDQYQGDLTGKNPYKDTTGYYYQVVNPQNGYNGCSDPLQYLDSPVVEFAKLDSPAQIQTQLNIWQQALQFILSLFKGR